MCCYKWVYQGVTIQSAVLIVLLMWSSEVNSAPAEKPATSPEESLGDSVFKKQEQCEGIISDTIDEILNDEDSDLHDIPIADESYHECKETLDKMKREYMSANQIEKSTYPEFFPIKLSDGTLELISVPDEEDAERNELVFDVNEELCVTGRKCARLLDLIHGDKEKEKLYKEKFAHCSVLLEDIKIKYIHDKELYKKKLKDDKGLSTVCTGRNVLMPLPYTMNNLDYKKPTPDLFGDIMLGDSAGSTPGPGLEPSADEEEDEMPYVHIPEGTDHERVQPAPNTATHVKGVPSNARVDRANLASCVLVVFVLITAI